MKILVTGCNGFVGRHAQAALRAAGHEVIGCDVACPPDSACLPLDVRDLPAVCRLLTNVCPDAILHLGGLAFVPLGWTEPQRVFAVNTIGTLNILDAVRQTAPATRVLVVTSAEVYGSHPAPAPLTEDAPYLPDNIYGVAKAAADQSALLYAAHHKLAVMVARPSNHIGAGQSKDFVSTAFAAQLAAIAAGAPPVMRVGNLDQQRDFTDVRDVARAYALLLAQGRPGLAYNIASGLMRPVRDILTGLCEISGLHPRVETDPALFRPNRDRPAYDTSRIRQHVGWQPLIPLRQTLADIYADIQAQRASS
ncbi:MAG TPA: GDP-mannose 4,6-dehydratase [Kiritimatiellia bacterium]|nr:GDP-mannose 4,6-dehydratase [Kiritimatiellia bacterium]HOD99455.1 GDP-mannose 4,6-dehydratase [Kiritimatiellia bacterium]HOE36058.1 GDP-mannose 4,6-dehydratase [Kiritimatiellia bacterium]HOR73482.1 GDP-mannose 4,6-dehydratase [Kiritimatiellia bacterium]HOU58128.1 GDP-mannose 4,6-dehydratase [Kiritimatiellia bacterium]